MSRAKISIYVDEVVWQEFKAYVMGKHGKLHGVLGEEVTKALEDCLSRVAAPKSAEAQLYRILRAIIELNKVVDDILEVRE
ncbi:hypothetical protein [Archaeoglobus neptunius]|uniref:hypothetical protein n=1 Tax=Archaeoglobus neptunius TaxID=2798580 RepID=UPI001929415A|nr:hypothetical protein [Archaeoglobus neptunius]